jgi:hypothetical protein
MMEQFPTRPILATIAARSALRAVPLLAPSQNGYSVLGTAQVERLILSTLRAGFLSWAHAVQPDSKGTMLRDVANAPELGLVRSGGPAAVATDAALSAALCCGEQNETVALQRARDTVVQASYASTSRARALEADYQFLRNRPDTAALIYRPLWLFDPPPLYVRCWNELTKYLLDRGNNWDIWTQWYKDRLRGFTMNMAVIGAWRDIPPTFWSAGARVVNPELRRLEAHPESHISGLQREPELEPGPEFDVTEQGLSLKTSAHPVGLFDQQTQRTLHEQLKHIAPRLEQASRETGNAHPGLLTVTTEYAALISQPFDHVDITALWAVGAGLLANRDAFARAHDARIMTEPLEPNHFALLQQACEIHGGFILGFPQGRELAERADHARISGEAMEKVVGLARSIIDELRSSGWLIETRTRRFLAAIEDGLIEPGWKFTRAGYAAYVVTRNALIAIGRLLNWANSTFATVAGGIVLTSVDPGLAHTQFWIEFVLKNSSQILAFAEPFPELKIWLAAQIDAARADKEGR